MIGKTNASGKSATLTTKSITTNGTYNASSEGADGYSSVDVDVYNPFEYMVKGLSDNSFRDIIFPKNVIFRFRNLTSISVAVWQRCFCDECTIKLDNPPTSLYYALAEARLYKIHFDVDTSQVTEFRHFLRGSYVREIVGAIDFTSAQNNISGFCYGLQSTLVAEFVPNTLQVSAPNIDSVDIATSTKISFANALNETVTNQYVDGILRNTNTILGNSILDETETYHLFVEDENGEMTLQDFVTNVKGWTIT